MKNFIAISLLGLSVVACQGNKRKYVGTWDGSCDNGLQRVLIFDKDNQFHQKITAPRFFGLKEREQSGNYEVTQDGLNLIYLKSDNPRAENRLEYLTRVNWIDKDKIEYQTGNVICTATRFPNPK